MIEPYSDEPRIEYLAFASMSSDIIRHPETEHHHTTNQLGMMQLISGHLETAPKMRAWINGYN